MESQTNPSERAHLLTVSSEHASDWLNDMPVPSLGLKLDNTSIRVAVGLRLGANLCQCGAIVDMLGRHGLCCNTSKDRWSRHGQANETIRRSLVSAQIPSIKEPPGLLRDDQKRPDGLTLLPWSQGKSLVWDYTCSDTLAPSHVPQTSKEAGSQLKRQNRKSWATTRN